MSNDEEKGNSIISKDKKREFKQVSENERLLAMFIYITGLLIWILGPIIIWLLKREESEYIDYHGKEGLNFVISYTAYFAVLSIFFILSSFFSIVPLIGWIPMFFIGIIFPVVAVVFVVFVIVAAIKAYNNELYKIPFIFRFIN